MYLAIAVESKKHPKNQSDYRIWYLELNSTQEVVGVGVKDKDELLASLFESYQQTGKTNWRALKKGSEESTPIEVLDFIGKNSFENTHFGNLPTLAEFQTTINSLQMNLEMRSIA